MASPLPIQAITGNLAWGNDGSAWASYQVAPFGYPHRSVRDAHEFHARTTAVLLALPRHSVILSVARHVSGGELERRIAGESTAKPGWGAHARRTAGQVTVDPVFERVWFLSIRLPDPTGPAGVMHRLRAAASEVTAGFGLTHTQPDDARVDRSCAVAAGWEEQLGRHINLTPLAGGQVRWLFQQTVTRGLNHPTYPTDTADDHSVSVVRLDRDAVYYEGGRREDPDRPRHRRYLTVDHPDHGTAFQTFACLAETPPVWTFPYGSGEWLWHLDDQLPFPVDWAVRLERVDNDAARRKALRAKRNLVGQLTEPGGDPAGPATSLSSATEAVDEHRARLEANPALPAFRATTIVALAHRDLGVLERRAAVLESTFMAAEHNFYRPTGSQLDCLTAMLPASKSPPVVAEYAQDLLPDGLASAMPFAGSGVGDPTGMLLGRCLDTQYHQAVLFDPAHGPRDLNRSASLAAVGELGAGKSFLAKSLAWNTVAMGGQVVAVDRTETGEYAHLARVMPASHQVVEVTDQSSVCLDPFQVFDTDELRLRYGVGFVTLLTATPPGSTAGTHCYRAAQTALDHAREKQIQPRLADIIAHLETDGPGGEVADKLKALGSIGYGRLVFDPSGVPVDLTADYVCFHIPGLRLPRRDATRDDLLAEELLGQSILYLVAAFSRRVLFHHPDRFAALLLDEAHALTTNPQGRALVGDLIRDGRKHFAAVWAFSQLAADLTGTSTEPLDALLGYRVVFRQSPHTAPAALAFLGSDDRTANLETVTRLNTGECLLRDPQGRVGVVAVAAPDSPDVAAALSTTPLSRHDNTRWRSVNGHPVEPENLTIVAEPGRSGS